MGLATVYGIVKQHGGEIRVRSQPGRGSTFEIYLPRLAAEATLVAPKAVKEMPRGSERILLVEDESTVRATVARMLRGLGYTVWEASTGDEALRLMRTRHLAPDLLITDLIMPHMSGHELAGHLAELCPACRVLFISGYADETVLRQGIFERGEDFLEKPFTMADLAHKVREVLDRQT